MSEHQFSLGLSGDGASARDVLDREVEVLMEHHRLGDPAVALILDGTRGPSEATEKLLGQELSVARAREAVARDRGFASWDVAVAHGDEWVDLRFEAAADAIQWGWLDILRAQLDTRPDLIRARSWFPHHAMLIHHVAANGIEMSRQIQSPPNAVGVLRLLLERGADPDAQCDIYGPHQTTLCLLVSSCVPADAGVQGELVEELCRRGADPNGVGDDCLPLWTAISFGYREAVDALVASGARIDNIVFAAAVGNLAEVAGYFGSDGRVGPVAPPSVERACTTWPTFNRGQLVEYALIWAAGQGRRDVVEYLLAKKPDLTVVEPAFGSTARGAARWGHHDDIVALLEQAATG